MRFFLITNSPSIAAFAVNNGVDRILIDLETLGKAERQGHLDTVMSQHSVADIARVREAIPAGRLMVRLNPINAGTEAEVEQVISAGADLVMLPMFQSPEEVAQLSKLVQRRTAICLLVETAGALTTLDACAIIDGVTEVHIGLNDLSLALGQNFMFQPLADGTVEGMARMLSGLGVPFGIGGIARVGEGLLPAELIIKEHVRLGSNAAILSRTFHRQASTVDQIRSEMDFAREINLLRQVFETANNATMEELCENARLIRTKIDHIAAVITEKPRNPA